MAQQKLLDVQGLRGLAVLLVVLFHTGLPLSGGFIGVDVFFVISGFVVGKMLFDEIHRSRRLNLKRFFARRARRLVPALAVMLLAVVLITSIFFWGETYLYVPVLALTALLSVSNIAIPLVSKDYFDPETKLNPLLHTWSLGVEEQFYIFFPLLIAVILMATAKGNASKTRVIKGCLVLAGSISFALSVLGSSWLRGALPFGQEFVGFYSPATRLWEFVIGIFIAAYPQIASATRNFSAVLAAAGLTLILFSAALLDEQSPHPGLVTLIPTVGTALVLISSQSKPHRLLSNRLLTRLGDFSYSWYLWHWPMIVWSEKLLPGLEGAALIGAALSIPIAIGSYKFVEMRFRAGRGPNPSNKLWAALTATIGAVAVSASVLALLVATGVDPRLLRGNNFEVPAAGYFAHASNTFEVCPHPVSGARGSKDGRYHGCLSSGNSVEPTVLIIGDSHAAHLFVGLAERFPEESVQFWDFASAGGTENSFSSMIQAVEDSSETKLVVISYRWQGYPAEKFGALFQMAIARLADLPGDVAIYNGGPTFPFASTECAYGRGIFSLFPTCKVSRDSQQPTFTNIAATVTHPISSLPGVTIVNSQNHFCSKSTCRMDRDGRVFFDDSHHLNIFGSRYSALRSGDQLEKLITEHQ